MTSPSSYFLDESLIDAPLESLRRFGTVQDVPQPQVFQAGPLSCRFEGGAVRDVRWRGVEVIRGISYLLRDTQWGTAATELTSCKSHQEASHFTVSFELQQSLPDGTLFAQGRLEGHATGQLSFKVNAHSDTTLLTNRCGLVVLHPASAQGVPLEIEHTDGQRELTQFPPHISPGQVAFDIRRLSHQPQPGLTVDCLLEAELPHDAMGKFEMEDQRNWSDASYKTYVASLLDLWPYQLVAGMHYAQSAQLTIHDARSSHTPLEPTEVQPPLLAFGASLGRTLPAIGLGVPLGLNVLRPEERAAVVALRPTWLIVEVDVGQRPALHEQLRAAAQLAQQSSAQIQLDAICPADQSPDEMARRLSEACMVAGCAPQSVRACPEPYLKSHQPSGPWPVVAPLEDYALALKRCFPGVLIGGGMLTYFTELNRKRPSSQGLDFVAHATCPLVHASDDISVMQTHEALPAIVASVRHLWPNLAYRLGPISIGMRRNPYGERTAENPLQQRVAMAQCDPRHQAAYGAAWVAAYAATVATSDIAVLSFNASHGDNGPLLLDTQPDWTPGACVPAWRVQSVLVSASGCALHQLNGLPVTLAGLAWLSHAGERCILLANLTDHEQVLSLSGAWQSTDLSRSWVMLPNASQPDDGPATGPETASPTYTQLRLAAYQALHLRQ